MKLARTSLQIALVAAAIAAGIRYRMGLSLASCETYCPFGGLETAWSYVTSGRFSCAMGELNVALFLGLVLFTLLARKAFCSWICPVGAVSEALHALSSRLSGRRLPLVRPSGRIDRALRLMRLPVLLVILGLTWRSGELVFRPCDPYYVMFSAHGHDVKPWSYAVVGAILVGTVLVPMLWCRWLCPLGAVLWLPSAPGVLRIRRHASACTGCRACDRACLHSLGVSTADEMRSGECTLCLECVGACPSPGAIELAARPGLLRPPRIVIPVAAILIAGVAIAGADILAVPSLVREYGSGPVPATSRKATFIVVGLRCVDTARTLSGQFVETPGVRRFEAHASRHRAVVTYDPAATSVAAIREAIEGAVLDPETQEYLFNQFKVAEIDGTPAR